MLPDSELSAGSGFLTRIRHTPNVNDAEKYISPPQNHPAFYSNLFYQFVYPVTRISPVTYLVFYLQCSHKMQLSIMVIVY